MKPVPAGERFESKINRDGPNGCWLWLGAPDPSGYGLLRIGRRVHRAHVLAWEWANGRVVPPRMCVCHTCDNPPCVNPAHLWLGTHTENMRDMLAKGRGNKARGAGAGRTKLTEDNVRFVRRCHARGARQKDLARALRVGETTISHIIKRENWAWLE